MLDRVLRAGGMWAAGAALAGIAHSAAWAGGHDASAKAAEATQPVDVRVEASFEPVRETYRAGEPFWYVIRVSWRGGPESPLAEPPRNPPLENLRLLSTTTANVIMPETNEAAEEFRYEICGEAEGPARIGTTDICLRLRDDVGGAGTAGGSALSDGSDVSDMSGEMARGRGNSSAGGLTAVSAFGGPMPMARIAPTEPLTMKAASSQLRIAAPARDWGRIAKVGGTATGGFMILAGVGLLLARRRRMKAATPVPIDPWDALRDRMVGLERFSIEGDYEGLYGEIRDIATRALEIAGLCKGAAPSASELDAWVAPSNAEVKQLCAGVAKLLGECESVRFGGTRPDAAGARDARRRLGEIVGRLAEHRRARAHADMV